MQSARRASLRKLCIAAALFCANALWRGMKTEVIPSDAVAVMTVTTPGLPADNAPAGAVYFMLRG